jgi:hypothetical protein
VTDTLAGWHDFYLTVGAAAATLAGLLFVGISLHVKIVAVYPDARRLARVTLSGFFTIIVIALLALVPDQTTATLGLELIVVALAALVAIAPAAVEAIWSEKRRALPRRVVVNRFGLGTLTAVGLALVGVLLAGGEPRGMGWLVAAVIILLTVCVRNTWDLLVTIAAR